MNKVQSNSTRFSIIVLLFLFFLCALIYSRIIIEGDGLSYYALALSLSKDHDFDLANQKKEIAGVMAPYHPVTKKNASLFSAGFGILYAPFIQAADFVGWIYPDSKYWKPYQQKSSIPFLHTAGIFFGSFLFSAGSLFFAWRLVREKSQHAASAALIPFSVFCGTPLIFYTFTMPAYSHAADTFLVTAIFYLVLRSPSKSNVRCALENVLIGALLALSILLRNNNVVLILPAVIGRVYALRVEQKFKWYTAILWIISGALPFAAIHAWFNYSQYGSMIATGYRVQTEVSFLFEMLFYPQAGLFIWSPVAAIGIIGLVVGAIRGKFDSILASAAVIIVLLSVQFQPNWWGGCSFGQRFFTHLFLFWCIGIVELIQIRKWILIPVSICALWTITLFNGFYINVSTDAGWAMLKKDKCRHSPREMLVQAYSDYQKAMNEDKTSGLPQFWYSALGKRYPTLIHLIFKTGS